MKTHRLTVLITHKNKIPIKSSKFQVIFENYKVTILKKSFKEIKWMDKMMKNEGWKLDEMNRIEKGINDSVMWSDEG